MRHGNKINHLGRTYSHRKAMLSNMATSLILHKRIETTVAKAKELRPYVEPIINRAKNDSTHNRRMVFSELHSKEAVTELFNNISGKVATRNGGYTRILKLAENRPGDNSEMCMMELVDYNENMLKEAKGASKKRTRRGKTTAKKTPATNTALPEADTENKATETTANTTEDTEEKKGE